MMIRTLSFLGAAIAAIAAAGTLAGCGAAAGTANASISQLEQRAITVDSVPGGEAGIPDLQAGRAQLVAGNYVSFILAQMAGKFGVTPQTVAPVNMRIIA